MRTLLTALLGAALVFTLAACQPDKVPDPPQPTTTLQSVTGGRLSTPVPSPSPSPQPTPTPTEVALPTPARQVLSVGLVGSAEAEALLPPARAGLQKAAGELGVETFVLDTEPGDLARNAARLAEAGYGLVIVASANPPLGDWLAKRYPQTRFAVFGKAAEPTPANLMGLAFAEDQAGFLAGALAGWLTERAMVAFVGARPSEQVVKFRKGYEHGVRYADGQVVVLGKYLESFTAPAEGAAEANAQLDEGADVLFAAGGSTARGALEAAAARGVGVIAAGVDPYGSLPKVAPALVTAVVVRADLAVQQVVKAAKEGTFKAGTLAFDVRNGGIELGPFHDWEGKVPEAVKKRLREVFEGLQKGSIKTDVVVPDY